MEHTATPKSTLPAQAAPLTEAQRVRVVQLAGRVFAYWRKQHGEPNSRVDADEFERVFTDTLEDEL